MSPLGQHRFRAYGHNPQPSQPPPPPPSGTFDLMANPAFDPDAPVLKDGTALSGEALTVWSGLRWLVDNFELQRYVEQGGSDIDDLADADDMYQYSRTLGTIFGEMAVLYRLTGWLEVLDEWVRLTEIMRLNLGKWRRFDPSAVNWPRHDYDCFVWEQGSPLYDGTDYHVLDTIRTHESIAHLLYALRLNQTETSPNGHDYEGIADFWESYFKTYRDIWAGPEKTLGRDENGNLASGWSANYRGQQHNYYYNIYGSRRASASTWPILSRHHNHTHVGACSLHIWLGLAIPDFAAALPVGLHGMTELLYERNIFYFDGIYGQSYVYPRSLHDTGHGSIADPGPGNYAEGSMYMGYTAHNSMNLWLEGLLPEMPAKYASGLLRTMNQYLFRDIDDDEGMHITMLQDLALTGSNSPKRLSDDAPLPFESAVGESGTSLNPRSNSNLVSSGLCLLMPWDTSDDHMEEHVWGGTGAGGDYGRMGSTSLFFNTGGTPLSRPRVLGPSLGLLMKRLGAKNWKP